MFYRRLVCAAFLSLVSRIAFAQSKTPQTISLVEDSCRTAPAAADLAKFIDINTGTIQSAANAIDLINALLTSNGPTDCLPAGISYVDRNFGHQALDPKRQKSSDFIIHVVRWADPAADPNSPTKLKVEQQRWYLIHNGQFLRPGRMFGAKKVYFIYVHLNKSPRGKYKSDYEFGITEAIPQNQQNLALLASILAPPISNDLVGPARLPSTVWGGTELDMWYSTAGAYQARSDAQDP